MLFDADSAYTKLNPYFRGRIRRNESLAQHCSLAVGGPADLWISLETQKELFDMVNLCAEQRWPLLIVGGGTNMLYVDGGERGIVAHIALNQYEIEDFGDGTGLLIADSGTRWPRLLHDLAPLGWGGLEFGVGIPGTLGGGIISNAGTHVGDLGQVLEWIEVLDARGCNNESANQSAVPLVRNYLHNELDLGYRQSRFRARRRVQSDAQGHLLPIPRSMIEPTEIVLRLAIRLEHEDPKKLLEVIDQHRYLRHKVEPIEQHSAPIFKDPVGNEASHLVEQVEMKGKMQGNAQISVRNANYIVNQGGARSIDVAALIMETHQRVLDQLGIDLELDVDVRGVWSA